MFACSYWAVVHSWNVQSNLYVEIDENHLVERSLIFINNMKL